MQLDPQFPASVVEAVLLYPQTIALVVEAAKLDPQVPAMVGVATTVALLEAHATESEVEAVQLDPQTPPSVCCTVQQPPIINLFTSNNGDPFYKNFG